MGIGDDYIEMAFRWANEADPGAKLFYNDFNAEGLLPKSNAVYRLVQSLLAKGTPIHGVGLQMHINQQFSPLPQNVVGNMQRLAALGLQIHVSEMDVRLGAPPSPEALAMQAQVYANVMNACLGVDACVHLGRHRQTLVDSRVLPGPGIRAHFRRGVQAEACLPRAARYPPWRVHFGEPCRAERESRSRA